MKHEPSTVGGLIKLLQSAIDKDSRVEHYHVQIQEEGDIDVNGDDKENCFLDYEHQVDIHPHPSPSTQEEASQGVVILRGEA